MSNDPRRFFRFLRMSLETFDYVCGLVRDDLVRHTPPSLQRLPNWKLQIDTQVAIALRRLASGDTLKSIGELFGVAESTRSKIVRRFVKSFIYRARLHISWPTDEAMEATKAAFQAQQGLVKYCGAIDVTHVTIELPDKQMATDYYDRNHNYSVCIQAIVDMQMRFLDVYAGFPRSVNDLKVSAGEVLNGPTLEVAGTQIREYIVGDAGYPSLPWILTPFPGRNLASVRDYFNYKQSSTRMVVERAFGKLKCMWRILAKTIYWRPEQDSLWALLLCCCYLHNVLLLPA